MSWAVQTAVLAVLNSDADLVALTSGNIHKTAPQDAAFPHVEFGSDTDIRIPTDCFDSYKCIVELRVWTAIEEGDGSRGPKQSQDICQAIQLALDKTEITMDGSAQTRLQWESTVVDNGDDAKSFLGIILFECVVDKNNI